MLCMIAVPTEQTQIVRETKFDDDVIPATARHAVVLRLSWIVAARIAVAIALGVVNRQELLSGLTATAALIAVVRKDDGFTLSRLIALPSQFEWQAFALGLAVIGCCLLPALRTQIRATRRRTALEAKPSSLTLRFPSPSVIRFIHVGSNPKHIRCA
jgi:hypothetical protein